LSNLDKTDKKQYNEPTVLPKLGKTDTPHNTQKKIAEEVGLGHSTIGRLWFSKGHFVPLIVGLGHSTIGRVIEFQNRIFRTYYKKTKANSWRI